ncbi:MAG: hypothetical protein JEZ14_23725 [Marinilabiliaceae bacterium]|nr:hypothetical protein [Marinilabiliaceae bacterium]
MYADGIAPQTQTTYKNTTKYRKEGKVFYGSNLEVELSATDATSGIETTYYSINGAPYQPYTSNLSLNEEQDYQLSFYSVDHVGNSEETEQHLFTIDKTAPNINWKLTGDVSGKTASGRSSIELLAMDALTGVKRIQYQIDDHLAKTYTKPIDLGLVSNGEHRFKFWAEDFVGNTSNPNTGMDNGLDVYAFIVDDVAPTASALVKNDQYIGKYLYVSPRSRCELDGEDDLLGVNKILYSFNHQKLDAQYESPLPFEDTKGLQAIFYQSWDMVANKSAIEKLVVYMDNEAPQTGIDFKGPQFFTRDTLFINQTTHVKLFSKDEESGIKQTSYKVDENAIVSGNSFRIPGDGLHQITFYSVDNVNNQEQHKESEVVVDNKGPKVYINFSIKPIRTETHENEVIEVYPPFVKMYIGATDEQCGTKSIHYSIDSGTPKNYTSSGSPADVELFQEEKLYSVVVEATDKLGNSSQKPITFRIAKK